MGINEYIENLPVTFGHTVRPRVECSDGFSVSIQASAFHYCEPRDNFGPYTHLELGFPCSEDVFDLSEYEDSEGSGVFAYVPVEKVDELLKSHGGIA